MSEVFVAKNLGFFC